MSKYKKEVEVSIPQSYDLGFCTVNKQCEFPFRVVNPNLKALAYEFKFTQFVISPAKGVLAPNMCSNFKIGFKSTSAQVIVGTVILEVEGEEQRVFKLSAVGKYPYIAVGAKEIDFGEVLVTRTETRELILKNSCEVSAEFNILSEEKEETFFSFHPSAAEIPPRSTYAVQVVFNPLFNDHRSIANYKVVCVSGNESPLTLKGHSTPFKVSFNANSLNFGEVKLESVSTKALTLTNQSSLDAEFEVYCDSNNVFCLHSTKGVIPKQSYKKIIVEFRPRNTIAYYERVFCIVRNQGLIYVDLIGTCYDLLIKPIPLLQSHVDTFRKRVIEGRISTIELKYISNNLLLKLAKRDIEETNFYMSNVQFKEDPYTLHKEVFLQNSQNKLISLNMEYLQFGFCEPMTLSGQQEIEVTSRLECKLSLSWISQKKENMSGGYMTVFSIYPQTATLKPNTPSRFQITFRPLKPNQYYFQHLQFFATKHNPRITKKTLQDFEYRELKAKPQTTLLRAVKLTQTLQSKVKEDIEQTEVLPPLCGGLKCIGHSFSPNSLPFLPILKVAPTTKVLFKPCTKDHSVYQSIQLLNQSDTPIYYKITQDKWFKTYPRIGLIEAKAFAIVLIEFAPQHYKAYKSTLSILLNEMPGLKLTLHGVCSEPQMQLENQGKIHFAPTFTGVCTKKTLRIHNTSKTQVGFKISVPAKYKEELSFEPTEKLLEGNQSILLNVFFVPHVKKIYKIISTLEIVEQKEALNLQIGYHNPGSLNMSSESEAPKTKTYEIEVNGEGADGSIQISETVLNFQTVKVTEQKKMDFKLTNTSTCAFYVQLSLKSASQNVYSAFHLSFQEGTIPANSQIAVSLTFSPQDVQKYDLRLIVTAEQKILKGSTLKPREGESTVKCEMRVLAEGNYPMLQIIDIRNDTLSVAALWENFQISHINHELGCKLDTTEKKYLNVEKLTFSEAKSLEDNLKHFSWNLGYVSTKSKAKPRKVLITVRNSGGTPLDYIFKFPSDNKVKEELWADPGEPSEQQAYEKAILENNIFQISPKMGRLEAKEVKDIELLYSPVSLTETKQNSSNQIHSLKVVFQVKNGKSLVFNLKGTTLGPNQGLITVKKNNYILPETPIGLMQPIHFPIQINNVGSIKVNYKTEIIYEKGQHPQVFQILNPSHFLMSAENYYIYCLYKPLVEKIYKFKILIKVEDQTKLIQVIELEVTGKAVKHTIKTLQTGLKKHIPGQRTTVSEIGSKVFFSIEEIDFQAMQPNQIKYRMIILYNMSREHSLSFDFPTQSLNNNKLGLTCNDKFSIQPFQGTLEPNKFIQIKITLQSHFSPSFYEGQIPCQIIWANSRYSTEDNDLTQKDVVLTSQKESLFLRIKKTSSFRIKTIMPLELKASEIDPKASLLDVILNGVINAALNDPSLEQMVDKLNNETTPLVDMLNEEPPAALQNIEKYLKEEVDDEKRDYSSYEYMLLNDEFLQVAQIVMENTFFNIVQQTTHQENDFLRVGKKFVPSNKI